MNSSTVKIVLIFISCILFKKAAIGQLLTKEDIIGLRENVIKLDSPSTLDFSREKKIQPLFENKDVIAIGESTHGTSEFFLIRNQIIKYLVEQCGVTVIALENDWGGLLKLNSYILNGTADTTEAAIKYSGLYGIYRTYEFLELVKWLKNYNKTVEGNKKVSLYGIDCQDPYAISDKLLSDEFLSHLGNEDESLLRKIRQLSWAKKPITHDVVSLPQQNKLFSNLRQVLPKISDLNSRRTYAQYIRLLEQSLILINLPRHKNAEMRDQFMTENIQWLLAASPSKPKIALLAHNAHITTNARNRPKRVGCHLRSALGERYFALALMFNEGASRIFDFAPGVRKYSKFNYGASKKENSVEFLCQKLSDSPFLLDIDKIKGNPELATILNKQRWMRIIGANYLEGENSNYFQVPLLSSFNALIYLPKAHAASGLLSK